jgi:hypothetical protein
MRAFAAAYGIPRMGLAFALVHTEMVILSRSEQPLEKERGDQQEF